MRIHPFPVSELRGGGGGPLFVRAETWSKEFGDPLTIWLGTTPFVIVSTKESFKDVQGPCRNTLGGRPRSNVFDLMLRGNVDVAFSDFCPAWDVLRWVTHVAIRKYAMTEKLAQVVANYVDRIVEEGLGVSDEVYCDCTIFIEDIVNNIVASSAFGEA